MKARMFTEIEEELLVSAVYTQIREFEKLKKAGLGVFENGTEMDIKVLKKILQKLGRKVK